MKSGENGDLDLDLALSCEQKDENWLKHKQKFIKSLKNEQRIPLLIECIDAIHNIGKIIEWNNKIGEKAWDKFKLDKKVILKYYKSLFKSLAKIKDNEIYKIYEEHLFALQVYVGDFNQNSSRVVKDEKTLPMRKGSWQDAGKHKKR